MIRALLLSLFSLMLLGNLALSSSVALADSSTSFYPTWKLLKPQERKLFISGYLTGFRDARRVTDILVSHVQNEPESAVTSLQKVREIYQVGDAPLDELLSRITQFYAEPDNHDAPLSVAISSSR